MMNANSSSSLNAKTAPIPVVFHILKGYDGHLLMQAISRVQGEIKGAFHSTKHSGMKFRVFHVTNRTVFSSWLDQAFPGFAREYEVNGGKK